MSRSPWREALDGQVRILRELRKPSSLIHLGRNADIPELRARYSDRRLAEILAEAAIALEEGVSTLIREAEPIYLSHDIQEALMRRLNQGIQWQKVAYDPDAEQTTTDILDIPATMPLTAAMCPIPTGLVYLHGRGLVLEDMQMNDDGSRGQIVVRAIYFGHLISMQMRNKPYGDGLIVEAFTANKGDPMKGLGIMLFIESRASGFQNMTAEFGDHLVPVILNEWTFGKTLIEAVEYQASLPKALNTAERGTDILMAISCYYLYCLFQMMLTRLTLWGGVSVHQNEQREALAEKLKPRVQLVTWRKANYKYPEGHIPVPKNWSCRWSVRPHYRRYKSGKTVLIQSYIKGPADRPYRPPDVRANQVIR